MIQGWDAVSGWDYVTRKPKAMKKLARPGSVYIIEVQNQSESEAIARHFWGSSLCAEVVSVRNGYGLCLVGNVTINDTI